jgi:hypothetical protein
MSMLSSYIERNPTLCAEIKIPNLFSVHFLFQLLQNDTDYDTEAWVMRRPWPATDCHAIRKIWILEYIRTGIVQMNWSLSLCDHRRFTELVHHVWLR